MAELIPAPFKDLVTRLYREPAVQGTLFELPAKRWFIPGPDGPDLSVRFHGRPAGNPSGPAAGPHTQMAQNLLLSYLAGGRILELKTVQANDRLTIPRPCIDMTNVGYNVEWSQELRIEDSLHEYVAGAMLIHMFRHAPPEGPMRGADLLGSAGAAFFDISVGYDLAGICSDKVRRFLDAMRDARHIVERLRAEIPTQFAPARALDYPTRISDSVTLSTFHGCPADEIERICEVLIAEHDLDVVVKMNPPTLGRERLEHLLHDVLGYHELRVNPVAYETGLALANGVQLCERLTRFAATRGRSVGFKFSNTLEVLNHRDFFTPDNRVMYLSGQPLHVVTLALVDEFRRAVGPHVPISFSAGIDQHNFPLAVACGFAPVTVCTDLLRPGGYGRLPRYLHSLSDEMRALGVRTIDAYVLQRFGQADEARRRAPASSTADTAMAPRGGTIDPSPQREQGTDGRAPLSAADVDLEQAAARWAGLLNTSIVAGIARQDPRYRAPDNRKVPKRVDSQLDTFDCLTCDKCVPVCPNAAVFTYPTPAVSFDYDDIVVSPDGSWRPGPRRHFVIRETEQIALYADFCNECGNCDTFCPEYGGPYVKKPNFFGSVESWQRAAPRDGFVVGRTETGDWIRGRIKGRGYTLALDESAQEGRFADDVVEVRLSAVDQRIIAIAVRTPLAREHTVDVSVYHTLRTLLAGVLSGSRVNQANAGV